VKLVRKEIKDQLERKATKDTKDSKAKPVRREIKV
jgi:hypothetical protein